MRERSSSRTTVPSSSTSSPARGPVASTTLEPLLSNDSVLGRETVSSMQRRVADGVTAGVNADFSRFDNGRVSGIFMRHGDLAAAPNAQAVERRRADGRDARRPEDRASRDVGRARPSIRSPRSTIRRPPGAPPSTPPATATATPAVPGSTAAVLFPFPLVTPGVDLTANVVEVVQGGAPVPIPLGGAVLVASGAAGGRARHGGGRRHGAPDAVRLRPGLARRRGRRRRRAGARPRRQGRSPARTSGSRPLQLRPRAPRSAVGQLPNGRIILVAVDGRQPGYSTGLTNAELARTMVRLGAVRAMALRRRRVDDARVRRRRPQQALGRARAGRRLRPRVPLRGRVPAAPRRAGLPERRRRR